MDKEKKAQEVDFGSSALLCSIIIGVTLFCSNILKNIPFDYEKVSLIALPWLLSTIFFAALSFISSLSLIGKFVTTLSNQTDSAWDVFPTTMFRFSVYVLVRWFIMWGFPFGVTFGTFIIINNLFGLWFSIPLSILMIYLSLAFIRKLFPNKFLKYFQQANLIRNLGRFPSAVIITGCFLFGFSFAQYSYIFSTNGYKSLYETTDTIEFNTVVKGVIKNHKLLTAKLYCIDTEQEHAKTLEFTTYDEGEYIIWRNLNDLTPGIYKVQIFFSNHEKNNLIGKIKRYFYNNHLRKQFIFRLNDGVKKKSD